MNLKIVVGGLVVENGMFPIVKEQHSHIEDLWNLPVGGLHENEKIVEGAKREIEEETGLKVEMKGLIGVYQNPERPSGQNAVKFIFEAEKKSGKLSCPEDLKKVKWVSFEEFSDIKLEDLRDKASRLAVKDYLDSGSNRLDFLKYY